MQQAYCEQHAFERGYRVISVESDKNRSGADINRPALWRAIKILPKGGVLLAYRRDRLARNVYIAEVINRSLEKSGCRSEVADGDVQGDGPEAELLRTMVNAMAQYERKIIGIRTSDSMLHKQSQGKRMGRYAPYGFSIDPEDSKQIIPNVDEQNVIQEILQKSESGDSARGITKWLNEDRRKQCRGREWQLNTVLKIIKRNS